MPSFSCLGRLRNISILIKNKGILASFLVHVGRHAAAIFKAQHTHARPARAVFALHKGELLTTVQGVQAPQTKPPCISIAGFTDHGNAVAFADFRVSGPHAFTFFDELKSACPRASKQTARQCSHLFGNAAGASSFVGCRKFGLSMIMH